MIPEMSVLAEILQSTRAEVDRRRRALPLDELAASVSQPRAAGRLRAALAQPGIGVIAEHKRRSPSAGTIRAGSTVEEIICAYDRGGAVAMSVLTESPHFEGSLDDLRAARAVTAKPLLRKDFVVDDYQLYEARAAGADAVLLIVAALPVEALATLQRRAGELGLDALVEVHDVDELAVATDIDAQIIGINNRDLRDFSVDVRRTYELLERMPSGALIVSESGIATRAQLDELAGAGVDAVLVGESLMRAPDVEAACRSLAQPR